MGNIGTAIKRFFSNKNTVTLLAIIVGTVILYFCYNYRVKRAVSTTYVCYATQDIGARTKITSDMVSTKRVLTSQITSNMVTTCNQVVDKYVSYAAEIPQNSFFYTLNLMTEDEMPNSSSEDIPDGYANYNFPVTFETTYGNSIFPGDYIDLYLRTEDEVGKLIYGKFIQSIEVTAVKDSNGKHVFESTIESRTPSQLIFTVPEDLYLLLKKAEYLGMELIIVQRNNNYTAEAGDVHVSSNYLKELILDQTATIPDECVLAETPTAECRLADNTTTENTDSNTNIDVNGNVIDNATQNNTNE